MIIYAEPKVLPTSFRDFRLACRGDVLPVSKTAWEISTPFTIFGVTITSPASVTTYLMVPLLAASLNPGFRNDRLRTNPRCIGQFPCRRFRKLV